MTPTPNPTAEQAERVSMEVLDEYRKIAAWLEAQAAVRGLVGDTMHGLAAEALINLIEHEYSRHKIPLYGMLDLWMALGVTSHPEFDEFYDEHGYAETWSRLLDGVRRLRRAHNLLSEGAPSEEQIERAAKAYLNGGIYTLESDGEHHARMRAALTAAGAAPREEHLSNAEILERIVERENEAAGAPAPSPDREKLIAEADALIQSWDQRGSWTPDSPVGMVMQLRAALAAQPVLDPEKVAEVIEYYFDVPSDRLELITRALCEAAKRGELT